MELDHLVEKITEKDENGDYRVPAKLMHRTILSVISGIAFIGFYMIIWAINDSYVNGAREKEMQQMAAELNAIKIQMSAGVLPIARRDIDEIRRRLEMLERKDRESQRP